VRVLIFCQSLESCWNHGNAHFLRGISSELIARGHDLRVFEPDCGWSRVNLVRDYGEEAIDGFRAAYPELRSEPIPSLDALDDADLVLVHEWSDPELVARIGEHHAAHGGYSLLFHDTHHRAVSDPEGIAQFDLRHYDGVLAFGKVIRDLYVERRWARRAWTWHEAADTRKFRPLAREPVDDLVWIGNWGDDERSAELEEFLIGPVRDLRLRAMIYGVRYPEPALRKLERAGIEYGGWLPNYKAPEVFSQYRVTVHVPRRYYSQMLPGIPTIRVFEALACGIPLVSAPWSDSENLFTPGRDFLVARDGAEMRRLLQNDALECVAQHGLRTVQARHTCAHRVDELIEIYNEVRA
jgi:spore maturation protein CgeB